MYKIPGSKGRVWIQTQAMSRVCSLNNTLYHPSDDIVRNAKKKKLKFLMHGGINIFMTSFDEKNLN
jgi:hypothetical protein